MSEPQRRSGQRMKEAIAKAKAAIARVQENGMATIDDYLAVEAGFEALLKRKRRKPAKLFNDGDPYSPRGNCL